MGPDSSAKHHAKYDMMDRAGPQLTDRVSAQAAYYYHLKVIWNDAAADPKGELLAKLP